LKSSDIEKQKLFLPIEKPLLFVPREPLGSLSRKTIVFAWISNTGVSKEAPGFFYFFLKKGYAGSEPSRQKLHN